MVDETRLAVAWNYMSVGENFQSKAETLAGEIADLVIANGGVDKGHLLMNHHARQWFLTLPCG